LDDLLCTKFNTACRPAVTYVKQFLGDLLRMAWIMGLPG
jgi:hypothetical protein